MHPLNNEISPQLQGFRFFRRQGILIGFRLVLTGIRFENDIAFVHAD